MLINLNNPIIIKPSSLNYKISLKQAVDDFIKKESKIDDYTVVVIDEIQSNEGIANPNINAFVDELDDILFKEFSR